MRIHKTIILPVVFYGREIWSLTLNRLKMLENRVLRRIFGPKRDEVTGRWRKVYNEELRDLSRNLKMRIYKTIILSVILYGCETWPLTLREEHRLPTTAAPTSFKSKLKKSFTRSASGHCLGTFETAKLCFDYTPLQTVVSLTTSPQNFLLSLSLSLSLSRLKMFENRVLRRIFGPNRDELTVGLRKLYNEQLRDLSKNLKRRIYKTIILPVILYGCETWSLTLREEHRVRVFVNKVLRRIFGPKRDELTVGLRKLHNEELRDLYFSPSIIRIIKSRRIRWAEHVARMGEKRNAYRSLVIKPEENHHEDQDVSWLIILRWIF
jgi:PAS domain-containing protein